jgi:PiT family inorganic phosphate transporter
MFDPTVLLILVVVLALAFDFSNGWHDSANAIATVVSTHVLSPGRAVLMAAVLNIAGAFMSTAVAKMIGGGIVEASMIQQTTVIAALSGAIAWNLFTLILGLPTSSSHALIGGIIGGALAQSGMAAVKLSGLQKVLEAMLFSPLVGFVLGYLIILATYWVMFRVPRGAANRGFRRLQLISSSFMAFSHGANDAQKAMGIITLSLVSAGYLNSVEVPTWVILACAVAMGLGTAAGGWRIVRTMGMRIMKMEPVHGFAAETSAALILLGTAHFGIPVSTTHTITSSIMGVGSVTRLSAVRWGVTMRIVYAWLFTLPGAGLVAYGATLAFQALR